MHTLTTADTWDDVITTLSHDRYAIAQLAKIAEIDPAQHRPGRAPSTGPT